jgi:hypothetical protein
MAFNQTARTLRNPGLFGVPQRLDRALGRNSARSIVPRRDSGCLHQRAKNKTAAGRRVGRCDAYNLALGATSPSFVGYHPFSSALQGSHVSGTSRAVHDCPTEASRTPPSDRSRHAAKRRRRNFRLQQEWPQGVQLRTHQGIDFRALRASL